MTKEALTPDRIRQDLSLFVKQNIVWAIYSFLLAVLFLPILLGCRTFLYPEVITVFDVLFVFLLLTEIATLAIVVYYAYDAIRSAIAIKNGNVRIEQVTLTTQGVRYYFHSRRRGRVINHEHVYNFSNGAVMRTRRAAVVKKEAQTGEEFLVISFGYAPKRARAMYSAVQYEYRE